MTSGAGLDSGAGGEAAAAAAAEARPQAWV